MTSTPTGVTRFAPAPTGYLHLGHVVNALYVWGLGRTLMARVLLRIEDHDAQRSRPEYERGILEDLDWLEFAPDLFPTSSFRTGTCLSRQHDRRHLYAEHARRLIDQGRVYACACTRQTGVRTLSNTIEPTRSGCPGQCQARALPLDGPVAWRLQMTDPRTETFDDLLCGPQRQPVARHDPVIKDRLGNWTYAFAVSVDDYLQGITVVIRGIDLIDATAGQVQIARLCGREQPARFAHHPLVMQSPTQKLSKSAGATGIRKLRSAGWTAARVIGEAAARVALVPPGSELRARDAVTLF